MTKPEAGRELFDTRALWVYTIPSEDQFSGFVGTAFLFALIGYLNILAKRPRAVATGLIFARRSIATNGAVPFYSRKQTSRLGKTSGSLGKVMLLRSISMDSLQQDSEGVNPHPNTAEEIWKPIPGYPGYEASDHGRIRSYKTKSKKGWPPNKPGRILKQAKITSVNGYQYVNLMRNGIRTIKRIHILIALTFIGERPKGLVICHNDGNKLNCHVSNLRYDTHKENSKDRIKHGTYLSGEQVQLAKLTNNQVEMIRIQRNKDGIAIKTLARMYGVSSNVISNLIHGHTYKNAKGPISAKKITRVDKNDIAEIKALRSKGYSLNEIAQKYGVSESYICHILRGSKSPSGHRPPKALNK